MVEPSEDRGEDGPPEERESTAFWSGARIGRYQLCFELASGGMAKVYLARVSGAAGFEKLVALKHIHSHLAERRDFVEMFMDEARIASRISHPNVCTVFDFGSAGRDHFIAMEYLAGETLGRISRRVGRDPERLASPAWWATALRIVADACEGLHAAHELRNDAGDLLQVIHRDVSPANVFVTYDGTVKVVDFGVARANERTHQTSAGQIKGHYAYMAPEHARGKAMDRRADIWSIGAVLFELLAGRRMMDYPNDAAILMSLLAGEVPSLSEVRPGLPDHLYAIVSRTLSMDPAGRPPSARELARELERSIQKIGEPAGRSEVEELMQTLFVSERQRRLALMAKARKMAGGPALTAAEEDSRRVGAQRVAEEPSAPSSLASHVRRAPDETAQIQLPDVDVEGLDDEPPTTISSLDALADRPSKASPEPLPLVAPGLADHPLVARLRNEPKLAAAALSSVVGLLLVAGLAAFATRAAMDDPGPTPPIASPTVHAPPPTDVADPAIALDPAFEPTLTAPMADPVVAAVPVVAPEPVVDAVAADAVAADPVAADPVRVIVSTDATTVAHRPRPHPREPVAPREPVGTGSVNVVTPGGWAEVFEGGRRIGRSPGRIELPAGRHTLELRPFGTGRPLRVSVTVTAGETTRIAEPVSP